MARRSPADEKPFRPLDVSVLNSVVNHVPGSGDAAPPRPVLMERSTPPTIIRREPEVRRTPDPTSALSKFSDEKRILFTRAETQGLDRLINNLAVQLNAQIKVSHIMRALTALLLNAEAQIHQRAGERGPITRPPNGDFAALQRFESEIASILAGAIRDAGAPR